MRPQLTIGRAAIRGLALGAGLLVSHACSGEPADLIRGPGNGPLMTSDQAAFQKGITLATWWHGEYATPEADRSLANLAKTGANWVAIVVTGYQETLASTAISRDPPRTPSDADLIHVIGKAHDLGLRVMLKPHVDLSGDDAHWRGEIGTAFHNEAQWRAWFGSYRAFIKHYAALARDHEVEQFSVGTELASTSHREADWRAVIRGVRAIFDGPIIYASNHSGEEVSIRWWDAVDYIGVDAYYPLTDDHEPTAEELLESWTDGGRLDILRGLAEAHDTPILLTEIGYRSVDGAIAAPWDSQITSAIDLQEQADAYRAALEALWGQPWLAGMYWWNWDTDPDKGGALDSDFTPYNKPAEAVLRAFYRDGAP